MGDYVINSRRQFDSRSPYEMHDLLKSCATLPDEHLGAVDSDMKQRAEELLAKLKTVKNEEESTVKSLELALNNQADALLLSEIQTNLQRLRKTKMELLGSKMYLKPVTR